MLTVSMPGLFVIESRASAVMRIGAPNDKAFRGKLVDDALHALATQSHCPR